MIRTGLLHVPQIDADASAGVRALLRAIGAVVIVEDQRAANRNLISDTLRRWCDEDELDLLLTVGGTLPAAGPSALECVPEATLAVLDRLAPALPEAMRAESATDVLTLLDRGVAGIRSRTLVVNLPAGGAVRFLAAISEVIPAYVAHLQGDPNAPRLAAVDSPEETEEAPPSGPARSGLNAEEFAAFLARKR